MKRSWTILVLAAVVSFLLAGCASEKEVPAVKDTKSDKLQIVATLFPQYDFARQIAGEKAEVTLILPPGVESHSYEPTPSDIVKINNADVLLYTGENMEAWAQKIIDAMENSGSKTLVLDVSKGIEHGHDPHIWTDPLFAKKMAANILDALCQEDPVQADYYRENAEQYNKELDALDAEFRTIAANGKRNEIIFGSRFALYYFAKRYGLNYEAAFDSCSSETEPSAKTVANLIEEIREEQIPVIYYAEMEEPKAARSISEETGAEMLLFHSCHNVTREELEQGATYLSLMKQNAENLKKGLE